MARRPQHLHAVPTSAHEIELLTRGRVPPNDLDAEAAVNAAILLDPAAYQRVADSLRAEHFYSDANRWIFAAIEQLHAAELKIDIITVADVLRANGRIERCGGIEYLAQIVDKTPAVHHVEAHAAIVIEHAQQRRAIAKLGVLWALSYGPLDVPGVVWRDQAAAELNEIAQQGARSRAVSVGDAAQAVMNRYKHAQQRPGEILGLPTGISAVDKATGGLHAPELTLVCGVEKKGKTSLAHSIALHVATTPRIDVSETIYGPTEERPEGWVDRRETRVERGVVIFSVDSMKSPEITERMICARRRLDSVKLKTGTASTRDWQELAAGLEEMQRLPILVEDDTSLTPLMLRAKLRAAVVDLRRRWGAELSLVIIDYVQLMTCDAIEPGMNEEQKLNRIGKSLLRTAEAFSVPMLVLSQLNAAGDTRDAKALQQHAQNKWVVNWKPAGKRVEVPGVAPRIEPHYATIDIQLTRNGKPGPCATYFHQTYTLYSDEAS